MRLALNATHSILAVRNSLKQADVWIVSTKNTVLKVNSNNDKKQASFYFLPVFYCR